MISNQSVLDWPKGTTVYKPDKCYNGFTIINPFLSRTVYLVNMVGDVVHTWQVYEPVRPDTGRGKLEDAVRITQHVMDVFDRAVREAPEQFFWYNKRWVLDPLPEDEEPVTPSSPADVTG